MTAKKKCLNSGMDDFLKKPCGVEELINKISELTVKSLVINVLNNRINIKKEMPMNQQHAKELREASPRFNGQGHHTGPDSY